MNTTTLPPTDERTPPAPPVGGARRPAAGRSAGRAAAPAPAPAGAAALNVIGLDLSLNSTGIASSRGWTQRMQPRTGVVGLQRLRSNLADLKTYLTQGSLLDLVVMEGPAYGRNNTGTHEGAGWWWLVRHSLDTWRIPTAIVGPTTLKKYATGNGSAPKDLMLTEAVRRIPGFAGGNDEADAAWLAAAGTQWLGHPHVTLPKAQVAALNKGTWPELISR